jgi:hypothetical protein
MATALAAPGVRRTLASARLTTAGRVGRSYLGVVSVPLFPPLIFCHLVAGNKKKTWMRVVQDTHLSHGDTDAKT